MPLVFPPRARREMGGAAAAAGKGFHAVWAVNYGGVDATKDERREAEANRRVSESRGRGRGRGV